MKLKLMPIYLGIGLALGVPGVLSVRPVWAAETPGAGSAAGSIEFTRHVVPALTKAGCNAGKCHGSFQGRGGFRLSLLGFNPHRDYDALVKQDRGRRTAPAAPDASLCLRKPLLEVPHGGGKRFSRDDPAYRVLHRWIAAGLPGPRDEVLKVSGIEVDTDELLLQPGERTALNVEATWSDGIVQQATGWALYESKDEKVVEVSDAGRMTARKPGRTAVTVRYMGQVAAVTVTVPYSQTVEFEFSKNNFIDEHMARAWKEIGLKPAPPATNTEFLRRVYLDVIGTLPTPEEVRRFVESGEANKREKVIDRLLKRPEYANYWAVKWGDLLRVHRRYVQDKGIWTYWNWVRRNLRENRPLDEWVSELLTARGSLFQKGEVGFYYVDEKPEELAETTAQVFLGVRLRCARCHHHPFEVWSQKDYYGLANYFTRIQKKDNGDGGRFGGAKLLRVVDHYNKQGMRVKQRVTPQAFGEAKVTEPHGDIRRQLAEWVTSRENPYFARNFVNRYWSYLMGRGLIDPVDDLRATNPASHPELLKALTRDFVEHDFDLKHLIRTICNSRVYQLASRAQPEQDKQGVFYTYRPYRRLPAEVLLDAVNQACGTAEDFAGLPAGTRAIELPDSSVRSHFLDAFGRSNRASPCECASTKSPDLAQALHLVNSPKIHGKVAHSQGRIARLLEADKSRQEIVGELYLATLSRLPSSRQLETIETYLTENAPSRQEGLQDVLWALLNSNEFVFNH